MNSAAKLRKRGIAAIGATALIATSFGPAALASWDRDAAGNYMPVSGAPVAANNFNNGHMGTIGLVDPVKGLNSIPAGTAAGNNNQGARLVWAGQKDQAISDVRVVLPNRFVSGDNLDLRLLDRSATETDDGLSNKDAGTFVGFSTAEGVTVEVSQVMDPRTVVNSDTDAVDNGNPQTAGNTETKLLPWAADTTKASTDIRNAKPQTAPKFAVSTMQSNNIQGHDTLRLNVRDVKADGDPNAVWVLTIKGLKVDLGANATPGELRLVPFLSNTAEEGTDYYESPWFYGNMKGRTSPTRQEREIGIYTVPAYVSPVKIAAEKADIVADGLPQSIGDLTVTETQGFSLGSATDYELNIVGATIRNTRIDDIKVTLENGGTNETVTASFIGASPNYTGLRFNLSGADHSKTSTIKISGLLLASNTSGEIKYSFTGGNIDSASTATEASPQPVWLPSYAGGSSLTRTAAETKSKAIYADSALLCFNGGAECTPTFPTNLDVRTIGAPASFPAHLDNTTGGAAVNAMTAPSTDPGVDILTGTWAFKPGTTTTKATLTRLSDGFVLESATNNYQGGAAETFAPNPVTSSVGAGSANDTYTITIPTGLTSVTFDPAEATGPATTGGTPVQLGTGAKALPVGNYTLTRGAANLAQGDTLKLGNLTLTRTANADEWQLTTDAAGSPVTNGAIYTIALADGDADVAGPPATGTIAIAQGAVDSQAPANTGVVEVTPVAPAATTGLPLASYSVTKTDGKFVITSGALRLEETAAGTGVFKVTAKGNLTGVNVGDQFVITGLTDGTSFTWDGTEVDTVSAGTINVTQNAQALTAGDYEVTAKVGNVYTIDAPGGTPITGVENGKPVTVNGQQVIFTGLTQVGQLFTVSASTPIQVSDFGVNQKDIVAPVDDLVQVGRATSESSRIGGNNRYETAAKIAERWAFGDKSNVHGKVRNAIIASGENFPDALSASYLSQRMGAPILLTQQGRLPADTIEALRDRQVDKVFIIGGPQAVSTEVEEALGNLNTYRWIAGAADGVSDDGSLSTTGAKMQVQRIGGGSRYTTNQLVNMYAAGWGGSRTIGKTVYKTGEAGKYTAIFARGDNFPDALAAGVLTAGIQDGTLVPGVNYTNDQALPLILTAPDSLSESSVAQIDNLDVQHALLVGGENALSAGVKTSIEDKNLSTTRIEGADRYFTAAAVAEFAMRASAPSATNEYPGLGFMDADPATLNEIDFAYLANGLKFPDALTAAPWLGRNADVLNLTAGVNDLSDGTKDFLTKRAADIERVNALGLGNAVSSVVLEEANRLASAK